MSMQHLVNCIPCAHCGSTSLRCVEYFDDVSGPYDVIECDYCKASAPLCVWNMRYMKLTDEARAAIAKLRISAAGCT